MAALALDVRHALRVFAKNGVATAMAVCTLAAAIGATTAIFSVVHGVLLRPLPYSDPDRLVAIWEVNHRGTWSRLADPNFVDFRDRTHSFEAMAKYASAVTSVVGPAEPVRAVVVDVSRQFFDVLGAVPAQGRVFGVDDARVGAAPVAVVSHRFWAQTLGSAPVPSSQLRIENRPYVVVGVMADGFQFPADADVWVPAELDPDNPSRTSHNYRAIARVRDDVPIDRARAELKGVAADIIRSSPEQGEYLMADADAVPLLTSLTGRTGSTLYVLLGASLLLLLIACANVANLLLAQATARQRELAVRNAIGAGRARLVRQFVVESLVLTMTGCAGGVLIAWLGVKALISLAPQDLPRLPDVSVSLAVLVFATVLSALVAVGLGLTTAMRATGRRPGAALADRGRGQAGSAGARRAGRIIVAAQTALTVILLAGAALLGRSLLAVLAIDPGFRTEGIVAMDVPVPYSSDPASRARLPMFYDDLIERLRLVPGVSSVAAVNAVPLDGGLPDGRFLVVDSAATPASFDELRPLMDQTDRLGTADYCAATSDYFRVLGIPLVRGRFFDESDRPDAPHVALVSQSLAESRWPGANPIGRYIEFGNMDGDLRVLTVVGVVGDTREYGLELPPRPTVYVNLRQRPRFTTTVVLRSDADPAAVISGARGVLKQLAADVPPRFRTFEEIYSASLGPRHFNLTLVSVFAGTALLLAVGGIYGLMAFSVTARRREMGVRVALGASPSQVFRLVIGQGLQTTAVGAAIGVVAALGLTRTISSLLFGITSADPATFVLVVLALMTTATLACFVPARRATRADPMDALRQD